MSEDGAAALVGSWRLRSWIARDDAGGITEPMGPAPEGLLVYAADGTMVAIMARGDRARFGDDDVTGGTGDERAAAFGSFIAYGGAYEVERDAVVHRVEHSLFPNWVGTVQRRSFELSGDGATLTLTSPPLVLGGSRRVQQLTWQRVER